MHRHTLTAELRQLIQCFMDGKRISHEAQALPDSLSWSGLARPGLLAGSTCRGRCRLQRGIRSSLLLAVNRDHTADAAPKDEHIARKGHLRLLQWLHCCLLRSLTRPPVVDAPAYLISAGPPTRLHRHIPCSRLRGPQHSHVRAGLTSYNLIDSRVVSARSRGKSGGMHDLLCIMSTDAQAALQHRERRGQRADSKRRQRPGPSPVLRLQPGNAPDARMALQVKAQRRCQGAFAPGRAHAATPLAQHLASTHTAAMPRTSQPNRRRSHARGLPGAVCVAVMRSSQVVLLLLASIVRCFARSTARHLA